MTETTPTTPDSLSRGTSPPHRPGALGARVVEDAKELGIEFLAALRDGGAALADEQRSRAAREIAALASVVHSAVPALEEATGPAIARRAEEAACEVDEFAEQLRARSWEELAAELAKFARRWPGPFIATAVGIGMVAGRILVSPPPRSAASQPAAATAIGQPSDVPGRRGADAEVAAGAAQAREDG